MKTGSLRRLLGYTFRYKWSFFISVIGFISFAFGKVVIICSYFINELSMFLINAFLCSEVLLSFL